MKNHVYHLFTRDNIFLFELEKMSTPTCGEWHEFAYYIVNNKCILGNNQSSALISGKQLPEIVIIPEYVNGHPVLELGKKQLST